MEQRTIIIGVVSALALVGIIILIIYLVKRDDDNIVDCVNNHVKLKKGYVGGCVYAPSTHCTGLNFPMIHQYTPDGDGEKYDSGCVNSPTGEGSTRLCMDDSALTFKDYSSKNCTGTENDIFKVEPGKCMDFSKSLNLPPWLPSVPTQGSGKIWWNLDMKPCNWN